ncbi:DUF3238 domain-containing protein [Paenibacillus elgii]
MSILLRVERESGHPPIELGDGKITGYSYINTSPADFFAKAYNAEHSIQIRGEIPLRLLPPVEKDADNSNTLYAWSLTEYRPDNGYYRTVTVRIVRHEKIIREIVFTHAYVHVYQEQVNGLKGVLEFELVVRQKKDQLDNIRFGLVEAQPNVVENKGKRVTAAAHAPKIENWESNNRSKSKLFLYPVDNLLKYVEPLDKTDEEDKKLPLQIQDEINWCKQLWEQQELQNIKKEIHTVANFLREIGKSGDDYAVLRIKTFIPSETLYLLDNVFEGTGDGRDFDVDATSNRTVQYSVINFSNKQMYNFNYTGKSHQTHPYKKEKTVNNDGMYVSYSLEEGIFKLTASLSSGNPIAPIAKIDYNININIDPDNKTYKYEGTTDGFPAYECYIRRKDGKYKRMFNTPPLTPMGAEYLVDGYGDMKIQGEGSF